MGPWLYSAEDHGNPPPPPYKLNQAITSNTADLTRKHRSAHEIILILFHIVLEMAD